MAADVIQRLLAEERIEQVDKDRRESLRKLAEARRHLDSAEKIAGSDAAGAYSILYDAARKAVDAHMLAAGLRVKAVAGAHRTFVEYAEAVAGGDEQVAHMDRIRRARHRSEYGSWHIDHRTLLADLRHAKGIVEAMARRL